MTHTRSSVAREVNQWFDDTLRSRSSSAGVLLKLQEELDELKEAAEALQAAAADPNVLNADWDRLFAAHAEEVADVGICLTVYAHLTMVNEPQAQAAKMEKNRSRTWVETETPGVWRHE